MPNSVALSEQMFKGLDNLNLAEEQPAWLQKVMGSTERRLSLREEAETYYANRNWDRALVAWRELLHHNPNDKQVISILAEIHLKMEHKKQAFALYERVVQMHLNDSQIDAAAGLLKKISNMVPADHRPMERLIRLLMQASNTHKGTSLEVRYRDQALVELRQLAARHEASGTEESALRYLKAIANLDPRDLRTAKKAAVLMAEKRGKRDAVNFLQGIIYELLKRKLVVPAEKMIYEGLRIDNGNPSLKAMYFLTQALDGFGNDARQGLERLHSQYPDNIDVVKALARLEVECGSEQLAGKWLIAAFKIDNAPHTQPLIDFGRKMLNLGHPGVAFNAFYTLAEHAWTMGKPQLGINLMTAIFKVDPHNLPALRNLVLFNLRADREQDAVYFLDLVQTAYKQQDRVLDQVIFLRECLNEFPQSSVLRHRLHKLQQQAA